LKICKMRLMALSGSETTDEIYEFSFIRDFLDISAH
jgi:hypothetical protein